MYFFFSSPFVSEVEYFPKTIVHFCFFFLEIIPHAFHSIVLCCLFLNDLQNNFLKFGLDTNSWSVTCVENSSSELLACIFPSNVILFDVIHNSNIWLFILYTINYFPNQGKFLLETEHFIFRTVIFLKQF